MSQRVSRSFFCSGDGAFLHLTVREFHEVVNKWAHCFFFALPSAGGRSVLRSGQRRRRKSEQLFNVYGQIKKAISTVGNESLLNPYRKLKRQPVNSCESEVAQEIDRLIGADLAADLTTFLPPLLNSEVPALQIHANCCYWRFSFAILNRY